MDDVTVVHSSDLEPERLQQLLADHVARDQTREFRRYFLTRFALVAAGAWLLGWPIHLLPHTVFWSVLASAAFAIGLMSPQRTHPATRGTTPKHPR